MVEVNEKVLLVIGILLFVVLVILNGMSTSQEGYGYTYPYSFVQCARRACPFEYRMAEYLTDQDAYIKVMDA